VNLLRAQSSVKFGGEVVRMEDRPNQFFRAGFARDLCGMIHESPADTLIAFGLFDIQIGDIQCARRAVGIVTEVIEQIANHTAILFRHQSRKCRPLTETIAQVRFGGQSKFGGVAQSSEIIGELPRQCPNRKGVISAGGSNAKLVFQTDMSQP
jgi:hypothetical protein